LIGVVIALLAAGDTLNIISLIGRRVADGRGHQQCDPAARLWK
jgi:hypothetical protein